MDDDKMNWWSEETGRKRENLEKTHAHSIYFEYSVSTRHCATWWWLHHGVGSVYLAWFGFSGSLEAH